MLILNSAAKAKGEEQFQNIKCSGKLGKKILNAICSNTLTLSKLYVSGKRKKRDILVLSCFASITC